MTHFRTQAGVLPGQEALPFLVTSGLPQQTLGEIWASADPDNNGFLTREGWYKAARLIGWMQKGDQAMDETLVSRGKPSVSATIYCCRWSIPDFCRSSSAFSRLSPVRTIDRTTTASAYSKYRWRLLTDTYSRRPDQIHQDLCRVWSAEWDAFRRQG